MIVCKSFKFDAAHFLPNYEGKDKHLHGHRWKIDVGIQGTMNKETGMVIDFNDLKAIVEDNIIENCDHKLLNDIMINPTAENMAMTIYKTLKTIFTISQYKNFTILFVRVWETEDSYAEYPG